MPHSTNKHELPSTSLPTRIGTFSTMMAKVDPYSLMVLQPRVRFLRNCNCTQRPFSQLDRGFGNRTNCPIRIAGGLHLRRAIIRKP